MFFFLLFSSPLLIQKYIISIFILRAGVSPSPAPFSPDNLRGYGGLELSAVRFNGCYMRGDGLRRMEYELIDCTSCIKHLSFLTTRTKERMKKLIRVYSHSLCWLH